MRILHGLPHHLAAISTVLWVGGTWVIGYLAVPVLFQTLPDKQLAGMLAGKMFTWLAFAGIGCALYLLVCQLSRFGRGVWQQKTFLVTVAMLVLLLIGQFAIQPVMADLKLQALPLEVMQSELAGQFKTLHGTSSILYLIQSLFGLYLVIDLETPKNI